MCFAGPRWPGNKNSPNSQWITCYLWKTKHCLFILWLSLYIQTYDWSHNWNVKHQLKYQLKFELSWHLPTLSSVHLDLTLGWAEIKYYRRLLLEHVSQVENKIRMFKFPHSFKSDYLSWSVKNLKPVRCANSRGPGDREGHTTGYVPFWDELLN